MKKFLTPQPIVVEGKTYESPVEINSIKFNALRKLYTSSRTFKTTELILIFYYCFGTYMTFDVVTTLSNFDCLKKIGPGNYKFTDKPVCGLKVQNALISIWNKHCPCHKKDYVK